MNEIFKEVFLAAWFFLPAGIANMTPIFAAKIPLIQKLDFPMDFFKTFRGKRVFGEHKTWRGLITGIIFGTLTLYLQVVAVEHSAWLAGVASAIGYESLPILVLGPLFGLGALLGDAIESFFKRQIGRAPGEGWFPFDQTDYIIGGAIATMPFVQLTMTQYGVLIVLWLIIHVVSSAIGYLLGLKARPI
ncbi:MAG: CDP-2,3-bis-(O-geranylgeranyl)-sn-glycerol synthase [Patescibacteria group bacterium]|nr:CDP-archaeol synthase [Candidatus Saccharibacteria bacterium]MDQ5963276.1 CDP-2,3-bis-(O-geranylgeranyl)-sn-glycerol synthase [Patescibacteria group bacterium]